MIATLAALVFVAADGAAGTSSARAFDHFYNLEYDQALAGFKQAVRENPADPSRYNHLALTLLYREMFKAGALESEMVTGANPFFRRGKLEPAAEVESAFQQATADAMSRAQAAIDRNPKDVEATYALGVAHGLRGNWNFLVRKAYVDALRDLTASRKLCNHVLELDPSFVDAKLVQGLHDYVVGSLPSYVRMVGFLAGFRGDKDTGVAALKDVSVRGSRNATDAKMLLGVIYRREKRPQEAIALLDELIPKYPRNYLFQFELAQMWADAGDAGKALTALDRVEALHKTGVTGYGNLSPAKIAFARGNIQFWYLQLNAAEKNLAEATKSARTLDLHTATMAWLRLGQTRDLRARRAEAKRAYQQVMTLAGSSDAGREARKYLGSPYRRS